MFFNLVKHYYNIVIDYYYPKKNTVYKELSQKQRQQLLSYKQSITKAIDTN